MEFVYVISTQKTYVDQKRKSETLDLWHVRFGYVIYHKLKIMIMKVAQESLTIRHERRYNT